MAGPLLIHASRTDCQNWLLIACSVVTGGLAYAALPDARPGGRDSRKVVRRLAALAFALLTFVTGLHVMLA